MVLIFLLVHVGLAYMYMAIAGIVCEEALNFGRKSNDCAQMIVVRYRLNRLPVAVLYIFCTCFKTNHLNPQPPPSPTPEKNHLNKACCDAMYGVHCT